MYRFPEELYADVRMEEVFSATISVSTSDEKNPLECRLSKSCTVMVRVFDGELWYTSALEEPDRVQEELDRLAALAARNPAIYDHPVVKRFEVHKDTFLRFGGEEEILGSGEELSEILGDYYERTWCELDQPLIVSWAGKLTMTCKKEYFYSSKGAELVHDMQSGQLNFVYGIDVGGAWTWGRKTIDSLTAEGLRGHEEELLGEMERMVDHVLHAADAEPGEKADCPVREESTEKAVCRRK